jgi:type III secretion protein J
MHLHPFRRWHSSVLAPLLLLAACSHTQQLYAGLSEADANDVVAALLNNGIPATKASAKQGFVVSVGDADLAAAVPLLREHGLPRDAHTRMGEVFKKDGMISTPAEERARYLSALAQELESSLSQIDGVVLARVHPVLPERIVPGEPVLPSSCAVLIKYRPGWNPDDYEDGIRHLVLASIPGLEQSSDAGHGISVVFVEAEPVAPRAAPSNNARYWWAGAAATLAVAAGAGAYGRRGRWRWPRTGRAKKTDHEPV